MEQIKLNLLPSSFSRLLLFFSVSKRRRPFRSESVNSRMHIDLESMIESGIRGEKGLVDARTNVKGKMREKRRVSRKAKVPRYEMRRCNDGCSSRVEWWMHRRYVSIRGKREEGGRKEGGEDRKCVRQVAVYL